MAFTESDVNGLDNGQLPTKFITEVKPHLDQIFLNATFYSVWRGKIPLGKCQISNPEGNKFIFHLLNMGGSVVGVFHGGIKSMCDFYGLQVNHTVEFSYAPPNNFTVRLFTMDEQEIRYPTVNPKKTVMKVDESEEGMKSTPPGFDATPRYCHELNLVPWTLRLTKSAATARQPLYIPTKYVENWMVADYTHCVLLNQRGQRFESPLKKITRKNRNEFYVGKQWGNLLKSEGYRTGQTLRIKKVVDPAVLILQVNSV